MEGSKDPLVGKKVCWWCGEWVPREFFEQHVANTRHTTRKARPPKTWTRNQKGE